MVFMPQRGPKRVWEKDSKPCSSKQALADYAEHWAMPFMWLILFYPLNNPKKYVLLYIYHYYLYKLYIISYMIQIRVRLRKAK